ncbi:TolC family protein [Thiobacter aerophilum]|uniref:TolC family protein n=1 Tax=Thiobacter aerophilum TaxID=3121275 RepID=A0ABV0EHK3_9BURK
MAVAVAGAAWGESSLPPGIAPELPTPLSLTQAQALAAQRNRELIVARRALEAARADVKTASQGPNATFSVNTTAINPSAGIGAGRPWDKTVDTTVRVDQPVERGGKRELRIAAAEHAVAASAQDLADTARRTRGAVAAAYYDLVLAQRRLAILRDSARLYRNLVDAAEKRLRAGDVAPTDVARIHIDAVRAGNDLAEAEAQLFQAQSALAYLLGAEAVASRLQAVDDWPALEPVPPDADLEQLISRRPDVQAAQARLAMADKNRELARALRKRDVIVGVQYEHFPPDGRSMYGFGISVPLFTGSDYAGEIRRAEVDRLAAEDAVERTRAQARTEVMQARAALQVARERVLRYRGDILRQAQRAADAAEFAYLHGAMGVMDLLDARRTLKATLLEAENAQADYARAVAAWKMVVEADQ